ncbi:MAG TPA: type II CAAX endopeptidase family protein [Nostoc sp.]|uniref:CPBP family intramembrane glutamic endopeptidase n=1 Tax=Nostoc sp. TaxID=1180 RepID=UPI002D5EFE65|nr:type II CAAX endopeptidase family protein [Nostoc sp.]HYX19174.1 type II CAAX endopeptidase family protein [Nostoc sp.]
MKHAGVVLGTIILIILAMTIRAKSGWDEGFGPSVASFTLALCVALTLWKTALIKQPNRKRFRFREILITASLIFGMIASSSFMNYVQIEVFGKTYHTSIGEPGVEPGSALVPSLLSVSENAAKVLLEVAKEEVFFRWIILSALLMIVTSAPAIVISSVIFAGFHLVGALLYGYTEPGLLSLLPTFVIGLFCGIAFLRHGLVGSIAVHFVLNLCVMLNQRGGINRDISVGTICFFAAVTLIALPLTLWFTRVARKQRPPAVGPRTPASTLIG